MGIRTLAALLMSIGAGQVVHADPSIQALKLLEENRISFEEFSALRAVNESVVTAGNFGDVVTDGNFASVVTAGNFGDVVTDGNFGSVRLINTDNVPQPETK